MQLPRVPQPGESARMVQRGTLRAQRLQVDCLAPILLVQAHLAPLTPPAQRAQRTRRARRAQRTQLAHLIQGLRLGVGLMAMEHLLVLLVLLEAPAPVYRFLGLTLPTPHQTPT